MHDPDRYALELIQEACSDLGSRLFLRIREKLGLAYYVGAQNFLGLVPGYLRVLRRNRAGKGRPGRRRTAPGSRERSGREGLTAEELKRAKAKVIGQKKIARQDLGYYAMSAALDELYGLGYAHSDTEDAQYEAVTPGQIIEVANRYLASNTLVISVIQPPHQAPAASPP